MKCPKCGCPQYKYVEKRKQREIELENKIKKKVMIRENNKASCPKCKYEGVE